MADVVHKVYTEDVYDGTSGQKVDERKIHAIGLELDGVFVSFLTKEDSYIQRKVAEGKAAQEQQSASETQPATTQPTPSQ